MKEEIARVALICTDRDQHPETFLGHAAVVPHPGNAAGVLRVDVPDWPREPGLWLDYLAGDEALPEELDREDAPLEDQAPIPDRQRLHIHCRRCGRHPQWTGGHANTVLRQLQAAGVEQLDISTIP